MPQPRALSGRFDAVAAPAANRSIALYRPGDEISLCRLFELVFGHRKTLEQWQWQFGASSQPHIVVARDDDGTVIGQFACVPRRVQVGDHELVFAQSVDSMVHPDHRDGLKHPGLFANIVQHYVAHFGRVEFEALGYGLPNRAALRIGRRFLGYTPLVDIWLRVGAAPAAGTAARHLDLFIAPQPELDHDELWSRSRTRFPLVAIRDRRFWEWRFAQFPGRPYEFIAARRRGELRAAAVYKASYLEPDCAALVDVLWNGDDEDALLGCLAVAEELAGRHGQHHLVTMLPERSAETRALDARGYRRVPSSLPLVARTYHPPLTLSWVRDHWWYSFADFDLV